jgi:hypothetical protein
VFVQKEGKQKAFHTGSNSSCRVHIRQHYKLYQRKCKEANIPEHHWAVPRLIWNEREVSQKHGKVQATLDLAVTKLVGPQVFTRKNLLHVVTQFVTVDNQVRLIVEFMLSLYHWSTSHLWSQIRPCFETVWLQ